MKNILKKVSMFLLVGILALAFTGCKDKDDPKTSTTPAQHKVEYVVDNNVYATYYVENGVTIAPIVAPTKANMEFDYWQLNNVEYKFSEAVVTDLRLVAVYKDAEQGSTITAEVLAQLQKIVANAQYEIIETTLVTNVNAAYKATKNNEVVTIYNVSKANSFITVEAYIGINEDGEIVEMSFVASDTIGKNDSFNGETLNINGSNSSNWENNFVSVSQATVSSNTAKDLISATFSQFSADNGEVSNEVYKVSFDSNGGTLINDIEVKAGNVFVRPNDPTRSLYRFVGWYVGEVAYDFTKAVNSNLTLTAKWISVFQFNSKTNTIVDAVDLAGSIEIPAQIGGVKVLALGEKLFYNNKTITDVTIPATIENIYFSAFENCISLKTVNFLANEESEKLALGINVFAGCSALTTITLPANLNNIPSGTFTGCSSLVTLGINDVIETIGTSAFKDCTSLVSISLQEGLTSIGQDAFANCKDLQAISLPTTLTTIGESAFINCTSLMSVYIPKGVTRINLTAFEGCTALSTINVDNANTTYASENGVLYNKRMTTLYYVPNKLLTTFELKNTVTSIDQYAFTNLVNLQTISVEAAAVPSNLVGKWTGKIYDKSSNLEIYQSGLGKYNNTNISGTYNQNTGIYSFEYTLNDVTYQYKVSVANTGVLVEAELVNGTAEDNQSVNFTKSSLSNVVSYQAQNGVLYTVTTNYTASATTSTTKITLVPAKFEGVVTFLSNTNLVDTNAFKNSTGITAFEIAEGNVNFVEIDHIIYRRASATSTYYTMVVANRNYDGIATILKDTTGTLSSIEQYCFANCNLAGIRFTSTAQIVSIYSTNVFGNVPSNFKVYIPNGTTDFFVGVYNTKWSAEIKAQVSPMIEEDAE